MVLELNTLVSELYVDVTDEFDGQIVNAAITDGETVEAAVEVPVLLKVSVTTTGEVVGPVLVGRI